MKNTKLLIGLVVVALLVIGSVWYFTSQNKSVGEITKVKIASLPNAHGLPVYLALEKGYFKDAGLDIELVRFEAPNQIIDALMQGNVDFSHPGGATGITAIADFKNPGKLKIYALAGGDDSTIQNDAILVKNDSTIKSIQDLKGKTLGIMAGTIQWQTIAREILAQNNLTYNQDVKIAEVALGLQAQALASGDMDATLIIEPVPTVVKAKGFGKELITYAAAKYIANPFYAGAGILRVDFAKKNPNTTKKVLDVIAKATDEINQNPNAARQYLKDYTQLDDSTIVNVPILQFRMYDDLTKNDIDATQKFFDIFTKHNVVNGKIDAQSLLYKP
jgi:NitT/TauT family transport system substrate-binding protein